MENRGVKRKKRSFVQKRIRDAKKGLQGRGSTIPDDTFEYFLHVLKVSNQPFENEEDKKIFVENVFTQLVGNEINYCQNQVVSRLIDNLIHLASDETLQRFMDEFGKDLRSVCCNPFSSHVLEKLLTVITTRFQENLSIHEGNENDEQGYGQWLMKVSLFMINNLEDFVYDRYANHVIRTVIICLSGCPNFDLRNVKSFSRGLERVSIGKEYEEIAKNFVDKLLLWPQFQELPFNDITSALLQILLQMILLVNNKRFKVISRKLLDECFTEDKNERDNEEKNFQMNSVPPSFESVSSLRLLETIIELSSNKLFTQIYERCFIRRLTTFSKHCYANNAVHKLIKRCPEVTQFEAISVELFEHMEEIFNAGSTMVIMQLAEGCLRFSTRQSKFLKCWMECLKCENNEKSKLLLAPLTIYLLDTKRYEEFVEERPTPHLHGSLILQYLLKFDKPIKVVNSLLEMDAKHLVDIFCDHRGSHICDSFLQSEHIGAKSREKLINLLMGHYTTLAISRCGSRAFDSLWDASTPKSKIDIANELKENESTLTKGQYGSLISSKISLSKFRHHRDAWIKEIQK